MKHTTSTIVILPIIFGLFACDIKRDAIGADDEIMVLVDDHSRDGIMRIIGTIFNDTLYTPKPEPHYEFIFVDPSGYDGVKELNNVIIGSIGSKDIYPSTQLVKSLLGEADFKRTILGENQVIFTFDQFANNQIFMIISGANEETIMNELEGKETWIKKQFDSILVKKQKKFLLESARRKKVESELAEKYPWTIQIPWGWEVIMDSLEQQFVWLGRETPFQWIGIYAQDGVIAEDSTTAANMAKTLPTELFGHISTHDYRFTSDLDEFKHWNAWRYTGIWESIEDPKGGPFISYLFYDGASDKTYFIYLLTHYPQKRKVIYMKQLDVIAHSFRIEE